MTGPETNLAYRLRKAEEELTAIFYQAEAEGRHDVSFQLTKRDVFTAVHLAYQKAVGESAGPASQVQVRTYHSRHLGSVTVPEE